MISIKVGMICCFIYELIVMFSVFVLKFKYMSCYFSLICLYFFGVFENWIIFYYFAVFSILFFISYLFTFLSSFDFPFCYFCSITCRSAFFDIAYLLNIEAEVFVISLEGDLNAGALGLFDSSLFYFFTLLFMLVLLLLYIFCFFSGLFRLALF